MGGSTFSLSLILMLTASMLAVSMANKDWHFGFNYTNWPFKGGPPQSQNDIPGPRKIVVGGSENWQLNFNYTNWALKNGPFYLNDTLVFKYDPPTNDSTIPHSVYLLPNLWSFLTCDLRRATMVANTTQGGGEGFKFVLKKLQPYYFACGERDGYHCKAGQMKFFAMPLFRQWH
ncbi:hypothetical protein ACB092_07G129600 [Castanea dentata]